MKLIVALMVAVIVGGCSSLPMQKAESDSLMVCDYAQMDRVERVARTLRTQVQWVNCPMISRERAKSVS